jgi:hypothetical protein
VGKSLKSCVSTSRAGQGFVIARRQAMTADDMIRIQMTAAGMLMEDLSAKVVLYPLHTDRPRELRGLAGDLNTIADVVDSIRRVGPTGRD